MTLLKNLLFTFLFACSTSVFGQPATDTTETGDFVKVDQEASFPGGLKAWTAYLSKGLDGFSPSDKGSPYGKFTVIALFIVDIDGSLSNIQMLTSFGYGMED